MRPAAWLPLILLLVPSCGDSEALITVRPERHDFGAVLQGTQPEFVFSLTNHSNRTVGFKAQPNCACFAVAQGLRPLEPGETLNFSVLFDSTAKPPGPVESKWITIYTDHPGVQGIVVPLEGEIYRAYDVTPASFRLGRIDGRPANYEARVIRVRPASGYSVRLERAVGNPPAFALEESPSDSGGFDMNVSIPRDMRRPIGPFLGQVRLDLVLTPPGGGAPMRQSTSVRFEGFWSLGS